MSLHKPKFREIVFQVLYSRDLSRETGEEIVPFLMKEFAVTKKSVREACRRADLVMEKLPEIDEKIAAISTSYSFERIRGVERNVLRLGMFELLYDDEIPPKVAITEAMRIAKKFGTPESITFVNAVLDAAYRMESGKEIDAEKLTDSALGLTDEETATKEWTQEKLEKDNSV